MANERLSDLSEAEILESLEANPELANAFWSRFRKGDPVNQLMDRLYGDKVAKKDIQKHSKRLYPDADIPAIDIPNLVREELTEDLTAIKTLRTNLETNDRTRRHEAFRAKLQEAGADAQDLDAIETFMVENEIGPKSLGVAVEKFYETKEIQEPAGTGVYELPTDTTAEHMKRLLSTTPADDLDRVNEPWVMQVAKEYPNLFPDLAPTRGRRR